MERLFPTKMIRNTVFQCLFQDVPYDGNVVLSGKLSFDEDHRGWGGGKGVDCQGDIWVRRRKRGKRERGENIGCSR